MRFRFKTRKLEALYTEERGARKYEAGVIDAFFEVVETIRSARDERDLYALKSLRFEQLSGNRKGERSLRLNDQWRLIVVLDEDEEGKYLLIDCITDYH